MARSSPEGFSGSPGAMLMEMSQLLSDKARILTSKPKKSKSSSASEEETEIEGSLLIATAILVIL